MARTPVSPSAAFVLTLALLAACGRDQPAAQPVGQANDSREASLSSSSSTTTTAAAPPAAIGAKLPARFHGVYDRDTAACAAAGDTRLTVSAGTLRFHESIGAVREVAPVGPDAVRVTADFEGEGEKWRSVRLLRLSDEGGVLTVSGDGTSLTRVRCPAPGEAAAASPRDGWNLDGTTLSLRDGAGRLVSLSCPAGSDELLVNLPGFKPIGSEERMSLGAGGTVVALVADTRGDPKRGGVTATGPVPAELAAILADPAGISVSYGAGAGGPHPTVPPDLARRFLAACR